MRINKRIATDVAVIGGGTAGVFAALGAKNAGADVILIEKNNILGGTMTQGRVCFPGLFHAWGKQIIGGYGFEAVKRALRYEGREMPVFPYKSERHWHQQIALNEFYFA
ncbi:MAG: FAD-dependent oxidoreductase, partial [Candidatus Scatosoma sp.]